MSKRAPAPESEPNRQALSRAQQVEADCFCDQRLFVLPGDQFDRFVEMLKNPPPPDPKLRALMRRTPIWSA